jgi:hypothetical protein
LCIRQCAVDAFSIPQYVVQLNIDDFLGEFGLLVRLRGNNLLS